MTRGQFEILLAKLDDIDERLRAVEVDVAGNKAVRKARQEGQLDVKWRAGIVASILGALITLGARVFDMLSNGGK
jgi:hypothetical protein